MNPPKKFTVRQQAEEQQEVAQQHTKQASVQEFATAEEMLRHDALHTPVPASIAQRLQKSLAQLTPNARARWWRRFFGE